MFFFCVCARAYMCWVGGGVGGVVGGAWGIGEADVRMWDGARGGKWEGKERGYSCGAVRE